MFLPSVPLTKPRTVCACHSVAFMISASVQPPLRCIISTTSAFLLPSLAGLAALLLFAGFAPFAVLAGAVALGAFLPPTFAGAASVAGSTVAFARPWIAFQTRDTPAARLVNRVTVF